MLANIGKLVYLFYLFIYLYGGIWFNIANLSESVPTNENTTVLLIQKNYKCKDTTLAQLADIISIKLDPTEQRGA